MLSIQRLRERMPLIVFILLAVLLLMLVGITCACLTDHPMQAAERTISAISATPAIVELWTYAVAAFLAVAFVMPERHRAIGRASPADLQRFRF